MVRERCGPNTVLNNGAAEWNWQNLNSILLLFEDLWNVAAVHEAFKNGSFHVPRHLLGKYIACPITPTFKHGWRV
jgi:hypothetical protein